MGGSLNLDCLKTYYDIKFVYKVTKKMVRGAVPP